MRVYVVICAQELFCCIAMDFSRYYTSRSYGCFVHLEIGFVAFLSNLSAGRQERADLRLANHRRLLDAQAVIEAIVSSAAGLSLLDRTDILAGPAMCLAVADMSMVVAESTILYAHVSRPMVVLRPPVDVYRPRLASDSAYLALTLCVFPKHRGYLESYEMDQGVRLVKAGLLVAEYADFEARFDLRSSRGGGMGLRSVSNLIDNLRYSILARLRRLSLSFVPVGSRDKPFFHVLSGVRRLCRAGGSCYRAAMMDPLRPRAMELRSRAIELLPPV